MKKILFISHRLTGGGSERVLVTLANEFSRRGHPVTILSYLGGETYPIDPAIRVRDLQGITGKPRRIAAIRRILREEQPDAVIAFEFFVNMQVILAGMGLGIPLIVSERNDPARRGGEFPNRIIRNFLYLFCKVLVCQTPDAKAYFPASVRRHAVIIPNPIKSDLPQPSAAPRRKQIVNFCRLQKQKNLPLLVDAFAEFRRIHSDYELIVYGDGQEQEAMQTYIRQQGMADCVTLHEAVADIHDRILDAAMFVSSSDYEGLSNSMIEAMAIGLPVVCTDCPVGGARMVIEDGINGMLVPVGDRAALTRAMCRVAEDEAFAAQLAENGKLIREKLSLHDITDRWAQLLPEE